MGTGRRAVAAAAILAAGLAALLALRSPPPAEDHGPAARGPGGPLPGSSLFGPEAGGTGGPGAPSPAATPGPCLRGMVVDGVGRPVAGAEVAAARDGDRAPRRTATDGEGRFQLAVSAGDGELLLGARAPGFAPSLLGGVRPGGPGIRIVLRPGIRLRGSVRDSAGAACAGARVRASLRYPGVEKPLGGFEAIADEAGLFLFQGIPPVEGEVEATARGASSGPVPFAPAPGAGDVEVDLRVAAGLSIEGTVRGAGGAALPGMRVTAVGDGPEGAAWAETGAEGRFAIRGLEGKARDVRVFDPSGRWREARFPGIVPPRTGLDATLEPDPAAPGAYSFRAVDPGGRAAGVLRVLEFRGGGAGPTGSSTAGPGPGGLFGPFRARAGPCSILLRGREGVASSGEFAVEPGATTDLGTLRLAPGAALRGRVLGPGGLPAPEALLFTGDDPLPERDVPGTDGGFRIPSLPAGSGLLRVRLPRAEDLEVPWHAGPGGEADLGDLRLRAASGAIRGSVRTRSGAPVEGALVRIDREGVFGPAARERETSAGADGRFEARELPAGRWRVSAAPPPAEGSRDSGFTSGRAAPPVDLREGEEGEVAIVLGE